MSLTSAIVGILQSDYALSAILSGGIYDAVEISRQLTPAAFDANGEILPCALVKTGNENDLAQVVNAVQTPLTIYFYQHSGFDEIDAALARCHALLKGLHDADEQIWQIRFNTEIARTTDEALYCSLAVQRYNVIRKKS
jgi:hypothetical protein